MKKITYSFLMLLMAMLALPASMIARETVTFDFAANPWGLPLGSGTGATAEAGNVTAPIVQDNATLSFDKGSASTPARMWTGPELRVYSGSTFTFTAPEGKVIEKIEFSVTKATYFGLSAEEGTIDASIYTWTQPAEQVNAVTFTPTTQNRITKAVLTIAAPGEAEEVVELPTAENIAAFKALDTDTEAELTLTDAKVLYVYGSEMIVEDATGAIDFYSIGLTATAGQVLNGTIAGKNSLYNGLPQLAKTSNTNVETVTVTDGDAPVAVGMTVAEAMAETSFLKYVKITDATLVNEEGTYYLVNGDNKIQIYNKFKLEYTLPEAIKSFAGIIIPYVKKGTTDVIVEIAPIAVEDIVAAGSEPEPVLNKDITAETIVNPGFELSEAVAESIATSGSAQGADYESTGWKLYASAAWSNSAVFAYGSEAQLNGVSVPAADNAGEAGKVLGVTVGWDGTNAYKSAVDVTLPAGFYTLKANAYNAGTAAQFKSALGFVAGDKSYTSSKASFALNTWEADEVDFVLDAETTGYFTIGGTAVSGGSGANGKVFFDNITLVYSDLLSGATFRLTEEIVKAKAVAEAGYADKTDLLAAIATAEAVTSTDYQEVLAARDVLAAAVAAYNEANAPFVAFYELKAKYTFDDADYPYATAEKAEDLKAALAKVPATVEEIEAIKTEIILAARIYVESNALAENVKGAESYTASIVNPNAEATDGWNIELSSGAKIDIKSNEPFTAAEGNSTHSYFDGGNWGGNNWDVTQSQTVTLPKGKYLLSVTSRASDGMATFDLFAGENTAAMPHVNASGELFDRGWNLTTLEFEVAEETADVAIGVHGATNTSHQWMSYTRFNLMKIDVVEPEPEPTLPEAGTYYIKNVATGKYLAGGSSWGTHAIVDAHGIDLGLAVLEDVKYTIDSQLSNGGDKHYLNGVYCDGVAFGWTLAMTKTDAGEDAVTISDGTNNLTTAEGTDEVLLAENVDDYSKWVFVSVDERMVELQTATADNGKDATWLLPGHNFGRNDSRNSNWSGGPSLGGDNTNFCAEKYNTTFDVYQTINVPNGMYKVEVQGFYRNGGYADAAVKHNDGSEQLLATAYANTVETPLQSIFTEAGKLDKGVTTDGIEGKFPNSMIDASAFFTAGLYNNVIENVTVVDGTLKVGIKKSEAVGSDWSIFDNIRLTYYGEITDLTAYKEAYEAALAAAQAALADEANAVVTGEELDALNAAIEANSTVEETKDAYVAATTALNEATNAFLAAKAAYQALADAKAKYEAFDTNAYPYAAAAKATAITEAVAATATSAEDATAKTADIVTAVRAFVESNALAEDKGALDFTSSIINANAEATESWNTVLGEGSEGSIGILSNEPFTDAEGNSTHSYFDGGNWGANAWDVTYSQDVTLPSGQYLLSATSRASAEMTSFALFAGEDQKEMTHVGASGEIFDRGWNDNFVVFNVHEDNSVVTLGVRGVADVQHQWMSFTRFRLARLGDPDAINNVNVETLDNATVYSVNGQIVRTNAKSLNGLAKGVYVVNGKKVVVK